MGFTYTWGDKSIELKDQISMIALSRFSDRAPELFRDITDIYLDREHWEELKQSTEKPKDEEPDENEGGEDEDVDEDTIRYQVRQRLKRAEVGFELTGHSVDSLQAMIDFCVSVTASVSGFEDDAGDPLVWKHADEAGRKSLYEHHVTSGQMVTIVLDCWAYKTGLISGEDKAG